MDVDVNVGVSACLSMGAVLCLMCGDSLDTEKYVDVREQYAYINSIVCV